MYISFENRNFLTKVVFSNSKKDIYQFWTTIISYVCF